MRQPIPPQLLARIVAETLREDLGTGDVTTNAIVSEDLNAWGEIRCRTRIVVAGVEAAVRAFRLLDPDLQVEFAAADGDSLEPHARLLEVRGRARALLSAERTALNFLGWLSGIATLTRRYVEAAAPHSVAISDTRKTTPTLRILEKYAVAVGGGLNHRFGLWDAVLIKDNHVDLAGGVRAAMARLRETTGLRTPVEVEVRSMEELRDAIESGAEAVLLDNFAPGALAEAAALARGKTLIEFSGGVRLEMIPQLAAMGVDRISIGALTHSAPAADLTMRITTCTT